MTYVETYYRARLADASARAPLEGALQTEVCVVGGGLAGLTTALELARAGRSVCVLEAEQVGWGASGRNGGFVSPGYSAGYATIKRQVGSDDARALHRLSIEGARVVAETISALKIDGVDRTDGLLSASRHESTSGLQAWRDRLVRDFDYPVEFWDEDRVGQALVSRRYRQGLFYPEAFHFDPLCYSRAIAAEIERLGGKVFEGAAAVSIAAVGAQNNVSTARGGVRAKDVVIATGGYTGRWTGRLFASFLPVATYVMLSKPNRDLLATAIRTRAGIGDQRRAGDYYRLVDGGERVLWGGKITTRVREPRDLADQLRASMVSTYPQLRDLEIETAWSGLMSYARHLMPQIGLVRPGVWCCTAFGGHGMNTTAIGGRVLAEAITGASDRYRLFAPFGLAWNGGPVGRMVLQATYWALQAQDWFNERGG